MKTKLSLFNTATRSKEPFVPSGPTIGLYCCGPTVYNFAHIGNLRTYIFEDVLRKTLEAAGHSVSHVVNITDVGHLTSDADTGDDKMESGASREGISVWDIAARYTEAFKTDMRDLNIAQPTRWVKATDHIAEMIDMVVALEQRGFTYRTSDGIYFDAAAFPRYGEFAGISADQLRAGERVDMGDKKSPMDFALWKFSPTDKKRQMEWESPWGVGFPGWHIECSAMALKYLSQPLDIHCGGIDHIRVHHTNEIAQVEASTGKQFSRFWLHGEFLVLDKEKMAKSGGNFITMATLKKTGVSPLAYRAFCFSAHYRSPLTFSWEGVQASAQSLINLRKTIATECGESGALVSGQDIETALAPFYEALFDDLNMPRAMAAIWELARNKDFAPALRRAAIGRADNVLSLDLLIAPVDSSSRVVIEKDGTAITIVSSAALDQLIIDEIIAKVLARKAAKKAKDFALADLVRGQLVTMGVQIKDLPGGAVECVKE